MPPKILLIIFAVVIAAVLIGAAVFRFTQEEIQWDYDDPFVDANGDGVDDGPADEDGDGDGTGDDAGPGNETAAVQVTGKVKLEAWVYYTDGSSDYVTKEFSFFEPQQVVLGGKFVDYIAFDAAFFTDINRDSLTGSASIEANLYVQQGGVKIAARNTPFTDTVVLKKGQWVGAFDTFPTYPEARVQWDREAVEFASSNLPLASEGGGFSQMHIEMKSTMSVTPPDGPAKAGTLKIAWPIWDVCTDISGTDTKDPCGLEGGDGGGDGGGGGGGGKARPLSVNRAVVWSWTPR